MLFYKYAYNLVKHAAIEFSYFYVKCKYYKCFQPHFVSEVILKTRIIKTKPTTTTFFEFNIAIKLQLFKRVHLV